MRRSRCSPRGPTRSTASPSCRSPPSIRWLSARRRPRRRRSPPRWRKEDKIKRTAEDYDKRGVDTGLRVHHPVTGEEIPIYVANFVLMDYGTGAVMAVPAHDQRDFEFAHEVWAAISRIVIQPEGRDARRSDDDGGLHRPGKMVNSGEFDGLDNETAKAQDHGRRPASRRSPIAFAIGCCRASAIGAARSRWSSARRTAISRCPTASCRCGCPTT